MQFSGVMIGTQDPHGLGEFYTSVLGEPSFQMDTWYGWGGAAQLVIGQHSEVQGANQQPQRFLVMLEVDDVQAEFDRITGNGGAAVAQPYQPDGANGGWIATVGDPDGNFLQLHTPMPEQ